MAPVSHTARYRRKEEFVARKIAGETVLVPLRQQLGDLDSIYTLNEVATFIWESLAEESTVAQIAAAVAETFAGEPSEIRQDVEGFLEQLVILEAILRVDGPSDGPSSTPPA